MALTPLEIILILVIIIIVAAVALYYFYRGSSGRITLTRPVESRIDEYLDRRFESIISEWGLARVPGVRRFVGEHEAQLSRGETDASDLNAFVAEVSATLAGMEERLDNVERELAKADSGTGT